MKKFTVISMVFIVAVFAGLLGYVAMSEDFVGPKALAAEGEDPNAPVWGLTMDDMMDYLEEKGFWDRSSMNPLSDGVGTEAYTCNGAELYWWDVENLVEGSNEAAAYQNALDGDPIDLWQQGTMYMPVTKNGPFAISVSYYTGDPDALLAVFKAFGQNGGGAEDRTTGVWVKTLDELADYLAEQGVFERDDYGMLSYDVKTKGRVGYHFAGKINIEYYDFDNLDEDSQRQYDDFAKMGYTIYEDGSVGYAWVNGPFTLAFYEWGTSPVPDEERPAIIEIFQSFCKSTGAEDRTTGVWVKTLDELADYLAEQGVVDKSNYISINFSSTTTGRSGYRFSDLIDIERYDFDNLDEASQENYDSLAATGAMVYSNGQVGYFWVNGPFTLHFYEWGKAAMPSEEEQQEIIDIFMAFGQE